MTIISTSYHIRQRQENLWLKLLVAKYSQSLNSSDMLGHFTTRHNLPQVRPTVIMLCNSLVVKEGRGGTRGGGGLGSQNPSLSL